MKVTFKISKAVNRAKKDCKKYLDDFKFNEALKSIWELIGFCDKYINEKKPWQAHSEISRQAKKNAKQVVSDSLFTLQNIADLLPPFLPATSEKIKKLIEQKKQEALFPRI